MHIDRVGPYDLVERIGAGGMAETFIGMRRGPGGFEQRVCIKRILADRANDPWFVGPFLDEARLLARMRCANIVQVHDFGESRGTYYMALELVEGADLDGLLRDARANQQPLPLDACLYVAAELLSALAYAHELSVDGAPLVIIHRDISPSNLLVSTHGEVKLTDFGIAKALGRVHKTKTGLIKGKLPYMSPEQVRGETLTQSTDLFSTGVLLYELFSGEHPFEGAADVEVAHKIMTVKRRPTGDVAPHLPTDVVRLVESLLAPLPADRPASARLALAALSNHVRFVAGQQLLAERVADCVARRARHQSESAQRTENAAELYQAQPAPLRERTQPLQLAEDASERVAQTAKNTTARPPPMRASLHALLPSRAAALGTGLGLLLLAAGVWVATRPSNATPMVTSSAAVPVLPSPAVRADDNAELPAGVALPYEVEGAPPAPHIEPLITPPRAQPLSTTSAAPVQTRATSKSSRATRRIAKPKESAAQRDSTAPPGRWTDVTPDQF